MTTDPTLRSGTQISHYRITKILGRGGFGITYQAWDGNLNRLVAIKEYYPHGQATRHEDGQTVLIKEADQAAYRKGLDRFLDEARTLAQFRDPRIVHVHGFQEAGNTAYMVMDFEEGCSLREHVLQHGVLSIHDARFVLGELLKSLQVIHSRNYLHRDIKPANIMRRPDGSVLLLDFGSARISQINQDQAFTVIVTPGYAPMEQYTVSEAQGPSTDLYAVGACLLFCLTGSSPIDALKRNISVQSDEPDPLEPMLAGLAARGNGGPEMAEILRRLLQPRADQRPQSAGEVLQRLIAQPAVTPATMPVSDPSQNTVLIQPPATPAAVDLAAMRSIPSKLVEPMRQHLQATVGDRATQVLFAAIRSAKNAQDLLDRVSEQLAGEPQRDQLVAGLARMLGQAARGVAIEAAPAQAQAQREPSGPTGATKPLLKDEETTQLLGSELAKYIGPIARMLVKKRIAKATSTEDLIAQLEQEIASTADRAAFRKAVVKLKILPG